MAEGAGRGGDGHPSSQALSVHVPLSGIGWMSGSRGWQVDAMGHFMSSVRIRHPPPRWVFFWYPACVLQTVPEKK